MINGDYILVVAPNDYPGMKYRDKYCYEHYLVYWQAFGVIPKDDEIIHHKDENKHHNVPENLELMKRKDHSVLHNKKRQSSLVLLKCPGCQKFFVKERNKIFLVKGGRYSCCSRKCIGTITTIQKKNITNFNERVSKNIVQEFKDDKSKYFL